MLKLHIKNTSQKKLQIVKSALLRELVPEILEISLDDETEESSYLELKQLYEAGIEISNFIGGVLVNLSVLDEDVPENFDNSSIVIDEETTRQKKWSEYTLCYERNGKALITVGYRDNDGNRIDGVSYKELQDYVNYFGMNKIKHKNDYKKLVNIGSAIE